MKSIFSSKTFWLNLLAGLVTFLESQQLLNIIPSGYGQYVALVVFGINIVLRYITVLPVQLSVPQGIKKE